MRINLIKSADTFYRKLKQNGVCFSEDGFPIFTRDMILDDIPKEILPFNKISSLANKTDTAICFFQEDERLYTRIKNVEQDISIFRHYMGVCGLDLSPDVSWPLEQQLFNILLSQLYTAYLAVNGIKIIPNWRIGDLRTLKVLNSYPRGLQYAVGTLGSVRKNKATGLIYTKAKILVSTPARLLIYGKLSQEYAEELDAWGISYVQYNDIMSKRNNILRRKNTNGC